MNVIGSIRPASSHSWNAVATEDWFGIVIAQDPELFRRVEDLLQAGQDRIRA